MSSIMDFIESMTNKEIHAKCLEYNLPNIPVTGTSRKVIIKRLHEAMTGIPSMATKKKNERRETMHETRSHETKQPNKEKIQSPKLQKRQTIAAPKQFDNNDSLPKSQISKRSALEQTKTDSIDDLRYINKSYANDNVSLASSRNDSRSSRSVSLTKSTVLTTSYSTETVPIKNYGNESDEVESDVEEQERFSTNYPTITHNKKSEFPFDYPHGATEFPTTTAKDPYDERARYSYTRSEYPLQTATNYDYEQPARYSFAATDTNKTVPKLRQTNVNTFNIDSSNSNPRNSVLNAPASSSNNNDYKIPKNPLYPFDMLNSTAYAASAEDLNAKPYMRQAATKNNVYEEALKRTSFISPAAHHKPYRPNSYNAPAAGYKKNDMFADEIQYNDEDVAEEIVGSKHFASNFARNLKHTSSPFPAENYKPLARPGIAKEEVSLMQPLREFCMALDQKYHLKRFTFIVALTLILLFIIVLLLP